MSYENLYNLTPRAFWNAVDGYWLDKENTDRKEWIRCRWQTCLLMNVTLPKKNQISLKQLVTFDWEKAENKTEGMATYKETEDRYLAILKRRNKKN